MVTGWIESEYLAIDHVRDSRERMPVLRVRLSKRRDKAVPRQAGADFAIFVNVVLVVVINELVLQGLTENGPRHSCDYKIDKEQTRISRPPRRGRRHAITGDVRVARRTAGWPDDSQSTRRRHGNLRILRLRFH